MGQEVLGYGEQTHVRVASSRSSMKPTISSRRKAGMTMVCTDLGVLGAVTVSTPWRLW